MPELPEVEAARRAIEEHCVGKKIVKSIIDNDTKVIHGVSASDFEASLLGKTILSAYRKGKNMWLQLDSPPFPSFQFGMSGAVYIKGVAVTNYKRSAVKDTDEWPSKYSKFFVELDDGLELSFTDKRRFAKVRLLKDPSSVPPISELGPDALLEPMKVDEFIESLGKKKIAIKTLLLDQSYISGIGNWIADEVLYQARIHPQQAASSLSKESCVTLLGCIKEVVQTAVEVDADCNRFPHEWLFHFRWGKRPGKVNGKKIAFVTVGGRTTAFIPELQKLNGVQAAKAGAKEKKQTSNRKDGRDDYEDNGVDELESDGEEVTEKVKSKRGQKPGGQGKKPLKKRKSKESDEENDSNDASDDDNANKSQKTKPVSKGGRKPVGQGKRSSNERKSKASDDNNNDHVSDDDDDDIDDATESQKKKSGKVMNNKQRQAMTTSTKNVASQNGKKPNKKAK